jgi:predicted RNA-binding protein (virulence factor B family)
MLNLGQINTLRASRKTDNGVYLIDNELNEVLLPNKYVPDDLLMDQGIDVFLYKDSEDRIIATTLKPKLMLNEYAYLEAVAVSTFGAFFDWGLEKDLLVPYRQQARPVVEGNKYVVYLYLDEKSQRLTGRTKINHTFKRTPIELSPDEKVDLLAYEETEIGISVVVNNAYQGLLFKNEIFEPVKVGDKLTGYVKIIRSDNKIDVRINKPGYEGIEEQIQRLYEALQSHHGYLKLNDKSTPKDITDQLSMSKKVFKKAVGALYKQKRLEISENGIRLLPEKDIDRDLKK